MTRCLPLGALLLIAAFCTPAVGSATGLGARPHVTLTLAGGAGEARAFELVARELLERLSVELSVKRTERFDVRQIGADTPGGRSERVQVWLDFSNPARSILYIHDLGRDRVLVRGVDHEHGMSEIAREELGHILQTSIEGLLAGAEIGRPRSEVLPRPEPPPVDRPEPPAQPDRERAVWQLSAHYEAELLSEQVLITHGPLAALSLHGAIYDHDLGLYLSAQYRQPLHATESDLGARLEGAALRAIATLDFALSPAVGLRFGLGGGVDIVEVRPEAQGDGAIELSGPKLLALGLGRGVIGFEFRLAPRAALWTQLVCDVDPSATRYVFARASGEEVVLYPFAVRPGLSLGLGFP